MRREAKDREFWYEFPHYHCPGDIKDYFWDDDNKRWVHVEDDDDMSWVLDLLAGKDIEIGKKIKPDESGYSGKEWKQRTKNCQEFDRKTWTEIKEILRENGYEVKTIE
jgi:hypothetical protein